MTAKAKKGDHKSSGNVYLDLGFEDADLMRLKAGLAHQIYQIIRSRKLKQVEAAEIMGIDQPKVSKLIRGIVSGYSVERLFSFLLSLNADINVTVEVKKTIKQAKGHPSKNVVRSSKGHLKLENLFFASNDSEHDQKTQKMLSAEHG